MNIFALHHNPIKAARYTILRRHINKMITESKQMLSNVWPEDYPKLHIDLSGKVITNKNFVVVPYDKGKSYPHHPCSLWVLESYDNWLWLLEYAIELNKIYENTFNKRSANYFSLSWYKSKQDVVKQLLPNIGPTPFAQAFKKYPECFISEDPVVNYRAFYVQTKWYVQTIMEEKNQVLKKLANHFNLPYLELEKR
jgi:hypothetical protein